VWSAPTIDAINRVLYVGTGDNHSAPVTDTSDAVLALKLDDGTIVWSRQLLACDVWNDACGSSNTTNCPEPHGPDQDLGSSANLIALGGGKRALTIGQKSGMVWALDPDGGRIVWSRRVGAGGRLGGVQWGTATNGKAVFVAVSDVRRPSPAPGRPVEPDPTAGGGLFALAAVDDAVLWRAPPAKRLHPPTELQPGAVGRCHRDTGLRAVGGRRRPHPRLFRRRRQGSLGLRHGEAVQEGQ
jgi:polyvinyl alcohol dehydrogenase (cytochrome)